MGNDGNIKRHTVDELRAMRARGESRSDWARVRDMSEAELEQAIAEDPDSDPPLVEPPPGWPHFALPIMPKAPKKLISLRLDQETIEHFKAMGPGYQTMMNGVLLSYVRAWKRAEQRRQEREKAGQR